MANHILIETTVLSIFFIEQLFSWTIQASNLSHPHDKYQAKATSTNIHTKTRTQYHNVANKEQIINVQTYYHKNFNLNRENKCEREYLENKESVREETPVVVA